MAEQILSTVEQKEIEKKKAYAQKVAEAERKVNPGEKIVSIVESVELQKEGAEVLAVFELNGVKVHKIKLPKKQKDESKKL